MVSSRSLPVLSLLLASVLVLACTDADAPSAKVTPISADALLATPPSHVLILDVRTREEYASGHVPGAINIPHTEIEMRLTELGTDLTRPVVVYCERGGRAGKAESQLLAAGFSELRHLEGDMRAWRKNDRPTERP